MSQVSNEIPLSKRFFPRLLPIIGDEKYKRVVARYQELFEKHEIRKHPALQCITAECWQPAMSME